VNWPATAVCPRAIGLARLLPGSAACDGSGVLELLAPVFEEVGETAVPAGVIATSLNRQASERKVRPATSKIGRRRRP